MGWLSIFCLGFRCRCPGIGPKVINCRLANTRDTHWGDYCWNRSNFIGRATYLVGKLGAEGGDLERRIASRLSTAAISSLSDFRVENSKEKDIFTCNGWHFETLKQLYPWWFWKLGYGQGIIVLEKWMPPPALCCCNRNLWPCAQSKYLSRQYCNSTQLCCGSAQIYITTHGWILLKALFKLYVISVLSNHQIQI